MKAKGSRSPNVKSRELYMFNFKRIVLFTKLISNLRSFCMHVCKYVKTENISCNDYTTPSLTFIWGSWYCLLLIWGSSNSQDPTFIFINFSIHIKRDKNIYPCILLSINFNLWYKEGKNQSLQKKILKTKSKIKIWKQKRKD